MGIAGIVYFVGIDDFGQVLVLGNLYAWDWIYWMLILGKRQNFIVLLIAGLYQHFNG